MTLHTPAPPRETFIILALLMLPCASPAQQPNYARDLVNPFIGTGGHGHTFPGACVPNGLVQLSPDTRPDGVMDWDGCGGYHYSDSLIYGFSHTHLSGTGVADLCDVLLTPMSGHYSFDPKEYRSSFSHTSEAAHAGYYKVHLNDGDIDAELTATAHVGVHRYTFPKGPQGNIVLDLVHRDKLIAGSIDPRSMFEVVGERRSSSWARDQRLFYCIRFNKPMQNYVMSDKASDKVTDRMARPDTAYRACFFFATNDDTPLIVKVGISAVSIEGARKNLETEVPGWDFEAVRKQAEDAWNAKLGKIQVEGGTREQQRIFYTALYHCYVAPYLFNDVDGSYRGMDGQVHQAEHNVYTVFSLWDTFRALHPLMTILEPDMTNDFIKTFLLHYKDGGRLPVWELWGNETNCMIGYHSVSVIADAYMKGIRGYDADLALKAMVTSAMEDDPCLNAYRKQGYISSEDCSESVSKTLEYAYDDACIGWMESQLKQQDPSYRGADNWWERSRYFLDLFDPGAGFFRARFNGGWKTPFDPFEVNFTLTEANSWQYAMAVQQNLAALKELHGGEDGLASFLDELFSASSSTTGREQADITGLIGQYAHGNEPSHHMAYLYNVAGKPWKTQDMVWRIMHDFYRDAPDGLIGNEDCGQMSAWFVLSAMGFYPVSPGTAYGTYYEGGCPLFDGVRISLPAGRTFSLTVDRSTRDAHYVSSGGHGWGIAHRSFIEGGAMAISLADEWVERKDPAGASVLDGEYVLLPATSPIIISRAQTFTDSLEISISAFRYNGVMMYDVNGTTDWPGDFYNGPFFIHETSTVRATHSNWPAPDHPIVTAHFTKIDGSCTVKLVTEYANQYAAGGDQALVDGLRGGKDFRTGEWQGFEGQDVLADVDLGTVKKLKRAGLSMLQDMGSWIWYPEYVQIAWSMNGRQWSSTMLVPNVDRKAAGGMTMELWSAPINKKARYIKVMAKNPGPCPDWHPGRGGASWIFLDEILIEAE